MEGLDGIEKSKNRKPLIYMLIPIAILLMVILLLVKLYERESPQFTLLSNVERVGLDETVSVLLTDSKSGLRSVDIRLVQGGKDAKLFSEKYIKHGFLGNAGPDRVEESFKVNSRKLGFRDGKAVLLVKVRDYSWANWMQGNLTSLTYPVVLDARPPRIGMLDSPRYIIPGGAGLVIYKIDEEVEKHGVRINGFFHPGYPLPKKGENVFGASIALKYDADKLAEARIEAVDLAGNLGRRPFAMILRKVRKKVDTINIPDSFLNRKLPEFGQYYPEIAGKEPVDQYLEINNRVRQENAAKIREICSKSSPERFWDGRFGRLAGSARKAGFAEYRTYYYKGKAIDHQVHLGVDLASTRQAAVGAANPGIVAFADYLGIYGNMVIIDHGQGVFSLYSHLSQINVAVGDMVDKGQTIALTGATGMAGGDHLHFSVLIDGVFVNPLEWWDGQWLKLNFLQYLAK